MKKIFNENLSKEDNELVQKVIDRFKDEKRIFITDVNEMLGISNPVGPIAFDAVPDSVDPEEILIEYCITMLLICDRES